MQSGSRSRLHLARSDASNSSRRVVEQTSNRMILGPDKSAPRRSAFSAFRQRLPANGNLSTTFQAGLMSFAHPSYRPRTAQHFIARDCSHRLIFLSCDARYATPNNGKAKRRPSFKPVSVRVRTSLSTRAPIDVRKRNFEARDFGLFEAQVRAGRHAETANVGPTYRVTCGNVGHY
jgi:hypothetical protein